MSRDDENNNHKHTKLTGQQFPTQFALPFLCAGNFPSHLVPIDAHQKDKQNDTKNAKASKISHVIGILFFLLPA